MINPIHQTLDVVICNSVEEAVEKGYDWNKVTPIPKGIEIKKVIVVRGGMTSGNSTVDFLLEDETGQQFVFMVTSRLLKSIPS